MGGAIVGILLAAGSGRRFGSDKLLHALPDGTPLAVAAARHLRPACDRVIAVLRPGNEPLMRLIGNTGCETLLCATATAGMGHSLAAGVGAAKDADGWLVALADMPFITTVSHQRVVAGLRAGASLAACSFNGVRGHPVGFAGRWFGPLATLTGDQGAKALLQAHGEELLLCPVDDPGVVWDVDRPEDLLRTGSPTTGVG